MALSFWLGLYLSVWMTLSLQHPVTNRATHFDRRPSQNKHAPPKKSKQRLVNNGLSRKHYFPGSRYYLDMHEKSTHELAVVIRKHYHLVEGRNGVNGQLGRLSTEQEWSHALNITETELRQTIATAVVSQSILIERHYKLVLSLARKYFDGKGITRRMSYQDVVQEGTIGLICAAERFDPAKDTAFSHYATYWIRQRISGYMRKHSRLIRLPSHAISALGAVEKTKRSFLDTHGREPTADEIYEACGVSEQKLRLYAQGSACMGSIENSFDEGSCLTTEEHIGTSMTGGSMVTPEESTMQSLLRDDVADLMGGTLTSREIQVLELLYGLVGGVPKSIAQVCVECEVTKDKVRRIEASALNKLRSTRFQQQF